MTTTTRALTLTDISGFVRDQDDNDDNHDGDKDENESEAEDEKDEHSPPPVSAPESQFDRDRDDDKYEYDNGNDEDDEDDQPPLSVSAREYKSDKNDDEDDGEEEDSVEDEAEDEEPSIREAEKSKLARMVPAEKLQQVQFFIHQMAIMRGHHETQGRALNIADRMLDQIDDEKKELNCLEVEAKAMCDDNWPLAGITPEETLELMRFCNRVMDILSGHTRQKDWPSRLLFVCLIKAMTRKRKRNVLRQK